MVELPAQKLGATWGNNMLYDKHCYTCKYWDQYTENEHDGGEFIGYDRGFCKRYPPTLMGFDKFKQPEFGVPDTIEDDWCGEYVRDPLNLT